MTVKQIGEATGKDVTTVQRWIKRLNGKMQSIDGKMQLSSPMKPADFTLEETCAIIEAGMGEAAAGVYRASAQPEKAFHIIRAADVLPNGKQLEEMRRIYGDREAGKRLDLIIGYPGSRTTHQSLPEPKAEYFPPELAAYKNKMIAAGNAMKARDEVKTTIDRNQFKLEVTP